MIGFAAMIFSHQDFSSALPMLTKLVFASSMVHQVVITSLSPLPFAIGQVQDTGMIFLASMASSIMTTLGPTVPLEERIATVLVHLSISTVLVGIGLILTGKARLASLVQYLPTPVIGGYLAYVGFFMVKGGVSLTTGVNLSSVSRGHKASRRHSCSL
jgi:SulP family sulfate permease